MLVVCSITTRLKQKIPNLKLAHLNDFTANATLEGYGVGDNRIACCWGSNRSVKKKSMKFRILLSKETAFFYWLQVISGWDKTASVDKATYCYYSSFVVDNTESVLLKIRQIINSHDNPRSFLQLLYSGDFSDNREAKELIEISNDLRRYFDVLWSDCFSSLEAWLYALEKYDFDRFDDSINNIVRFMGSSFDYRSEQKIYLLPNIPSKGTVGHRIRGSDFILLRPSMLYNDSKLNQVVCVIIHELLHDIEFSSSITRIYMKQSYREYIEPSGLLAPVGYNWKEMFIEALVYCFANNITGGYLRPEIFGERRPILSDFERKFDVFFKEHGLKTGYVISLAALCVLSNVEDYINKGLTVDKSIFDVISKEFCKKYLTEKTPKC